MSLSGRVALVTGAGSPTGIGFATAQLLAEKGARVAITSTTDRIEDRAKELAAKGVEVFAKAADLTRREQTQSLVDEVLQRYGCIDILVNNAGMIQVNGDSTSVSFDQLTEEQWDYGIAINLRDGRFNAQLGARGRAPGHHRERRSAWLDRNCILER